MSNVKSIDMSIENARMLECEACIVIHRKKAGKEKK